MNKYDIYNKAIKVIDSCENKAQRKTAFKYCKLAKRQMRDRELQISMFLHVQKKWGCKLFGDGFGPNPYLDDLVFGE